MQAWKGLASLILISKGAPATTVVRRNSYPFVSGTTTGAVLGRAGGKASEIATDIGSGIAVTGENIIMIIAMMTFKGIMIATVDGYKVCGKVGLGLWMDFETVIESRTYEVLER